MQLTPQELQNILVLIKRANITGEEAMGVAVLQQKITGIIEETTKGAQLGEREVKKAIDKTVKKKPKKEK